MPESNAANFKLGHYQKIGSVSVCVNLPDGSEQAERNKRNHEPCNEH